MPVDQVKLSDLPLPEFGTPTIEPQISRNEYDARLRALHELAVRRGIDVVLIWGDREHFANMMFLTGYDPRFEESILILNAKAERILLVGNEGMTFSLVSPVNLDRRLYQPLSLMGQDRSRGASLATILQEAGIGRDSRVGVIDWKYFGAAEAGASAEEWINAPAYLVDTLRQIATARPRNVTDLLMNPRDGLRAINSVDQLACFEFNSTYSSNSMRRIGLGMRPGMSEIEAMELGRLSGIQNCAHPVMCSGPRTAWVGCPSSRRMQVADPIFWSVAHYGCLQARAAFLVHDERELPAQIRDYVDKLVKPYFATVAKWYRHIGIGARGGDIEDIVHRTLGDPFFGVTINPGHLIHLDEWVHSPMDRDSPLELRPGMALQVDIIPATGGPYFTTNIEDGIALADEAMRREFAARWPEAWSRIEGRRRFMQEDLGIELKPEVLPLSNLAAHLTPYALSPNRAMSMA